MRREIPSVVYATLLAGSALLSGCASAAKTAYPPIQADLSSEAVARGESIFRGACEGWTEVPDHPASGLPVPPKGPTVEYGRYMARVLDRGNCHTDSLDSKDTDGSKGFAGGREFLGADDQPIRSANLTFDATGLQGWSLEDFVSTDALESGTPVRTSAPAGLARLVLAQATPKKDVDPAALFTRLGCTLCHAQGARYHDRIVKAADKSEQELAKWIRNPEQFVPGTAMPTYASLIDEPTALALARWIRSGGPGK